MIKSSEKLPRGSFFYIVIDKMFYAGFISETVVVNDVSHMYKKLRAYPKTPERGNTRALLFMKKYPNTRKPVEVKKSETAIRTGKTIPRLVESIDDAKQFRRRSQAEAACKIVARHYADLNIEPKIEYKGE